MDQRSILFAALLFVVFLLWQAWQHDYGPKPPLPEHVATAPAEVAKAPAASAEKSPPPVAEAAKLPGGKPITVETDLLRVSLNTRGGNVEKVELLKYPVEAGKPDKPFVLMDDNGTDFFVAQSGLQSATGAAPDHRALFSTARSEYRLQPDQQKLEVRLTWEGGNGLKVAKIYTFHRDSYVVDVSFDVVNGTTSPWQGLAYEQLQRTPPVKKKHHYGYTYTGGVIYNTEDKYKKVKFDDMAEEPLNRSVKGGWAAMVEHYFLAAWVPSDKETNRYYSKALADKHYLLGVQTAPQTVAPGASAAFKSRLFVGPTLQDRLEKVAPGLDLTVDYGVLHFLAKPIYLLLSWIHMVVGNWGWAIIILTVMIKAVFYKLSATSYKSMANMRKLQPRMAALKERFGDDKQKMQEATMKMYKEEKINPLGGCLPIAVQIPVFIALYWVLLGSVEMRQAPWIFWIHDLSVADPYFVLPIIMGVTMLFQQRLNPSPMDPIQAKVMMVLPVVFTFFFAFAPSGLVIYWVVNNVLSIAQQWYITKHVIKA